MKWSAGLMATARVRMVSSSSPGDEYGTEVTCIVGDCFEGTTAALLVRVILIDEVLV